MKVVIFEIKAEGRSKKNISIDEQCRAIDWNYV